MAELKLAYKPEELIPVLGLSRTTIYRLLKANRLPSVAIGHRILVPKKALDEFLETNTKIDKSLHFLPQREVAE